MRQPVGLDLNGWRDHASRDWTPEVPGERLTEPVVLDGGCRAVVVQHGTLHVGGPQALLSPIGRGGGWGEIGAPAKRRLIADHWSQLQIGVTHDTFGGDMRAAVLALSQYATHRVICIPDHAGFGEAQQKSLLSAFVPDRGAPPVLVWRSVAVVLGLMETGYLGELRDGMRVACLVHGPGGIERQMLVLRALAGHAGRFAPERARPGAVVGPNLSLSTLLDRARAAVAAANDGWEAARTGPCRMPADLLFNDEPPLDGEVMRAPNADWMWLQVPPPFPLFDDPADGPWPPAVADCTVVLSPLAERHRAAFQAVLPLGVNAGPVLFALPHMAAQGALVAARRIEAGIPHYLDRLDPVALAVLRNGTPAFAELVPTDATVPGNREYVSDPLMGFRWPAGGTEVEFFIRKGTAGIRRWRVTRHPAPQSEQPLFVQLRQMPAQGWASLSVSSDRWDALQRDPIRLEWETLEVDGRSEQEVLQALRGDPPVIPERVHYAAHIGLWDGTLRRPGLAAALNAYLRGQARSLSGLRSAVSLPWTNLAAPGHPRPRPCFPVDTDGNLPEHLTPEMRHTFSLTVDRVAEDLLGRVQDPAGQFDDNDALLFLTWLFPACPMEVRAEVLRAFDALLDGGTHKLLQPLGAALAIRNGVGRIVADARTLQLLLPRLLYRLPRPDVLAPLSSLLSRPEATPAILHGMDPALLDRAVHRLGDVFQAILAAPTPFAQRYKYAQLSLLGLLRIRQHQPWAFLAPASPPASAVAAVLKYAVERLEEEIAGLRPGPSKQEASQRKLDATKECITLLTTSNGRPDILSFIDEEP